MRTLVSVWKYVALAAALAVVAAVAWWMSPYWLARAQAVVGAGAEPPTKKKDPRDGHEHDHAHDDANSLELSPQARLNIGLTPDMVAPIERRPYAKTIAIPAMVVDLPGKTKTKVVAPMTGVVTDLYVMEGESIRPGSPMFKLRLLHEDLVKAQTEYLRTLGALDVEEKEINRIAKLTDQGAIAGRLLLERQYEKHRLQAVLRAQHEALLLHGLSEEQVKEIKTKRKLKSEVVVRAPAIEPESGEIDLVTTPPQKGQSRFVVKQLKVAKGDFVQAGGTMCVLSNYRKLYIQGRAFEQDADDLAAAVKNQWPVEAMPENHQKYGGVLSNLNIVYLDHEVDPDSRAFHFYVELPNKTLNERVSSQGHSFVTWEFRPGQRMQLFVPVAKWKNRIVLPVDAVVKEGAEYYVFVENGSHFDRQPVHVEYKDQRNVVLGEKTYLFPGTRVALRGAHQMQVALKNKAGGGVDPHAGHNH